MESKKEEYILFLNQYNSENKFTPKLTIVRTRSAKNAYEITFTDEDHTLGALLQEILSGFEEVQLCSYRIVHPTEKQMVVEILLKEDMNIKDILLKGLSQITSLCQEFKSEWKKNEEPSKRTLKD